MGNTRHCYGWRPDTPDKRDFLYKVARPVALPLSVDLRPWCPRIWDQGDIGSCTAQAICAALQFDAIKDKAPTAKMERSRLFVYYNERVMEDSVNSDSGAEIRDGIKSVATQGACQEALWWYNPVKWRVKPNRRCYTDGLQHKALNYYRVLPTLSNLKSCLNGGHPVVFGVSCYDSFLSDQTARTGFIPMPGPDESLQGGHAILMVGYDDNRQVFIFRNSWGTGWGDRGYGYLPYPYATDNNMADDFWTIRLVS